MLLYRSVAGLFLTGYKFGEAKLVVRKDEPFFDRHPWTAYALAITAMSLAAWILLVLWFTCVI